VKTNKKTHPADGCVEKRIMISCHKAGTEPQRFLLFHRNHLLSLEGLFDLIIAPADGDCQGKEQFYLFFLILDFSGQNLKNLLTKAGFIDIMR